MTDPNRLRQIEELYHAARESPAETRAALLGKADSDLRREVEELLEQDARHGPLDRSEAGRLEETVLTLTAGSQLGPYRIDALLGAGGMGQVYRAIDVRLDRAVAIKIVRARFTARFESEARAISSLNHPHICALYDVGPDYLVMELVKGETLNAKLKKGPFRAAEALRFAAEIADALAAAHAQGIVHRDLKPGNIMLTRNGIKILDFGLAKVATAEEPMGDRGMILGTRRYMSPEQAEGREIDARSDIYSLGLVLFEMLTARPACEASLLEEKCQEAGITLPAEMDWILRHLLAKDPAERWQSARDIKAVLERIGGFAVSRSQSVSRARLAWIVAAVSALIAVTLVTIQLRQKSPESPAVRFQISNAGIGPPALSPDGRAIVFSSGPGSRLMLRSLNTLSAQELPGTEGGYSPFWSPDGHWVAFFAAGHLKKLSQEVGQPVTITDIDGFAGVSAGTWSRDGIILYSPNYLSALLQVPAAGGKPIVAGKFGAARVPWSLPDGKHFLFTIDGAIANGGIFIGSIDPPERIRLLPEGRSPEYSDSGQLLFLHGDALMAQPFDIRKLRVSGDAAVVASPVASFSVASATLVYQPGGSEGERRLRWYDRRGTILGDVGPPADYRGPELSPDGREVAYITAHPPREVWVYDLVRETTSRLTFDGGPHTRMVWSPDGREIAFAAGNRAYSVIHRMDANSVPSATPQVRLDRSSVLWQWTPDGRYLTFTTTGGKPYEVWAAPLSGEKPFPIIRGPFNNHQGCISPNGKWISYVGEETGRMEVYVQDFPPRGRKWRVSTAGGEIAKWRADSRELFYREGSKVMSVDVNASGDKLEFGIPKTLFDAPPPLDPYYDVTPDGQKFLLIVPNQDASISAPLTVVLNWSAGSKKQ